MTNFYKRLLLVILSLSLILGTSVPIIATSETKEGGAKIMIGGITVDSESNPLGIDNKTPYFAWTLISDIRSSYQTAYRIVVALSEDKLNNGEYIWDTGKVSSDVSTGVKYEGTALESQHRYFWKVCVWNQSDVMSDWSENGWFETALLNESDWGGAQWIGGNSSAKTSLNLSMSGAYWIWHEADGAYWSAMPACTRYFRKSFNIDSISNVTAASIAITADDEYDLYVNGVLASQSERVSDSWKKAQCVDITSLLKTGKNVFAVVASNKLGAGGAKTGGGLLSSAKIVTASGETTILTNAEWLTSDALADNWTSVDFDDSEWTPAKAQQAYGSSPWGGSVSIVSNESTTNPAPLLRKSIWYGNDIAEARAYVCGLGYFVMTIDGKRVGTNVLDPGTTVYNKTALYVVHDVTDLLSNKGNHVIGITLGRGFYGLPAEDTIFWNTAKWLGEPRLRFKLSLTFTDGTTTDILSDTSWKTADSPTLRDSLYMGETYDATKEFDGWDKNGYDAGSWNKAVVMDAPTSNLISQRVAPIKVVDNMSAIEVTELGTGHYVLKYPVVTAGWAKMKVSGSAGDKVTLTYGETLRSDGTVNNDGSSGLTTAPIQVDTYILKGSAEEIWEPSFSYKGFQYIEVEGYPGTAEEAKLNITAQIVHSDITEAGSFESSNELLNKIHEITLRTMLNNTHSIITDTPMYEKRGWLGDANIMVKSTVNNFDMRVFYKNWLYSIRDNQSSSGGGTVLSPNKSDGWSRDSIWGGAIIGIPYTLYREYGDISFLEDNYEYMMYEMNYLRKYRTDADGLIDYADYGDWISPGNHKPPEDTSLVNSAYAYLYALMMEEVATVLNKTADAQEMKEYAEGLKTAFNKKWLDTERGIYDTGNGEEYRQTSNAVPLMFGLVPEEYENIVAENLVADVKSRGNKLNAGIAGVKELLPALSKFGYTDTAFSVATGTEYPSFGYWIENGATTLWEFWEATSRSRDHCMQGSIDDWFYSYLGGISAKTAGYKEININPYLPENLKNVKSSILSSYGRITSEWNKVSKNEIIFNVTVPVNTTANIYLPTTSQEKITEGGKELSEVEGIKNIKTENGKTVLNIGSGSYSFKISGLNQNVNFVDTSSNTGVSFEEKAKYLTAVSNISGTSLKLNGLTMEYLRSQFSEQDNLIEDWSIVGYTGVENKTFKTEGDIANLKDIDFWCNGSASGNVRSGGTFATRSDSASGATLTSSGNSIGYENTVSNPLSGLARLEGDYYDAKVTLKLNRNTAITDIYIMGQWTTDLAIPTYAIYVSDNEEDLYSQENQICLFDYYEGYSLDKNVSGEDKPHKLTCKGRNSEGQLWSFKNEKPRGQYIGIKVIDASVGSNSSYLGIMDIGVFGEKTYSVEFLDYSGEILEKTYVSAGENVGTFAEKIESPFRYGYVFNGWDGDVDQPIYTDAVFLATYKRDIQTKYTVDINDESTQQLPFDSKIVVRTGETALWKVNEQNFNIGRDMIAFVFGDMKIEAHKYEDELMQAYPQNKAFISLLDAKQEGNKLIAFVHLYRGEEEISEYGATFINEEDPSKYKNLVLTEGNDAMLTLYGTKEGSVRSVKGYCLVGETPIYSERKITAQF